MSSFGEMTNEVRDCTSMHAYEPMIRTGSTARVEVSSMPAITTGAVGRRLQHPVWKKKRSHYGRNPWNFQFNPIWLTSAWRGYIIMPKVYITMEWRGQQHAREAVESTASSATSTTQITSLSAARMKKFMEEFIPDWRVDQSIQKSSVFQHTTRVEWSSYSSTIGLFSYKSKSTALLKVQSDAR